MSDEKHVKRHHGPSHEKPKDLKKSLKDIISYSKSFMPLLIISIICACLSAVFSIIAPDKLTDLVNTITDGIMTGIDFTKLKSIVVILVIIYLLSAVFSLLEGIISAHVANTLSKNLRDDMSKKINNLPLKYFDEHTNGDVLSRITNDVDQIGQSINQSLGIFISAVTLLLGSVIMMLHTNVIMAITAIVASLIGFVFVALVLSKSQKYFIRRQKELGLINGHIEEIYTNYNVVKTYNGGDDATKKFDELNENLYESNLKSQFLSGLMFPFMGFIGNLSYVAVCIVGAILTMNGTIEFGVIVAFIVYARLFTNPLSQIAQSLTALQSAAASSERVFEFLESTELESESNLDKSINIDDIEGKIEFKNVRFSYEKETPVIKDFSIRVNPYETIAIVGPTGAGKTTIVNLLMKFYNTDSGDILIDDISIKDLTRENVHDLFTMVLQDTWLFEGTIRDNIVFNKDGIKDEDIMEALKTVGLEHFIKSLPNGLDTKVSDTESISAGQRQLLTIARGMIKNSPLLILDEATSNVDTRTEKLVQSAMDKLSTGKTSFVIAHRLSTIKNADLILVMKEGNIIETGNHDSLMKKNGFYAELYNSQFEL